MRNLMLFIYVFLSLQICAQSKQSNELFAQGVELYNKSRYNEAIEMFLVVDSIDRSEMQSSSNRIAYASNWISSCYYKLGDVEHAKKWDNYAYKFIPVDRKLTEESDSLSEIGMRFLDEGKYKKALACFLESSEIEFSVLGEHPWYVNSLEYIANILLSMEKEEEAMTYIKKGEEISKRISYYLGEEIFARLKGDYLLNRYQIEGCEYLKRSAAMASERGCVRDVMDDEVQILFYTRALTDQCASEEKCDSLMRICLADTANAEYANIILNLEYEKMFALNANCKHEDAVELAKEILKKLKANGDESSWMVANCFYILVNSSEDEAAFEYAKTAIDLYNKENYTTTGEYLFIRFRYFKELLRNHQELYNSSVKKEIMEHLKSVASLVGKDNEAYVSVLNLLAEFSDDVKETETFSKEAYDIARVSTSISSYCKFLAYSNMFKIMLVSGDVVEGVKLASEALDQFEKSDCPKNWDWYNVHLFFLNMAGFIDDYEILIEHGEECRRFLVEHGKTSTEDYADVLTMLGKLYGDYGNIARQSQLFSEAYSLYDSLDKKDGYYNLLSISDAELKMNTGASTDELKDVVRICDMALSNTENVGLQYRACINIVKAYVFLEDYANAHVYAKKTYSLTKDKQLVELDNNILNREMLAINALFNLLFKKQAEVPEIELQQFKQVISFYEKSDDSYSLSQYLLLLLEYVNVCVDNEDFDLGKGYVTYIQNMLCERLRNHFLTMTFEERTAFWSKYSKWYEVILPLMAEHYSGDKTMVGHLYDGMLVSKGILLNSEIEAKRFFEQNGDESVRSLYAETLRLKQEQNTLSGTNYVEMEDSIARLEKQLMRLASSMGDYTKSMDVSWRDVQKSLTEDDVAIEFVKIPQNDTGNIMCALVLKKGSDCPSFVRLFNEEAIKGITDSLLYLSPMCGTMVWDKLLTHFGDSKNIYFSPVGILNNLAIEHMPLNGGGTISDAYNVFRISSTRELSFKRETKSIDSAELYGDIAYNASPTDIAQKNQDIPMKVETKPSLTRSLQRASIEGVHPLPGTKKEILSIDSLLSSVKLQHGCYSGINATEERFKSISASKTKCLHVATHGYFLKSETEDMSNDLFIVINELMQHRNGYLIEDRMLLNNGLLLAGVNTTIRGLEDNPQVEDGILTAAEIATLDLSHLDMVVLSACETGLGIITGDGVFGLQRGFKRAGANSILMSLWKVDDEATCKLMTEFYSNWIGKKMTKHDALEAAKKTVRETKGWEDPKYWAAFILLDGLD